MPVMTKLCLRTVFPFLQVSARLFAEDLDYRRKRYRKHNPQNPSNSPRAMRAKMTANGLASACAHHEGLMRFPSITTLMKK